MNDITFSFGENWKNYLNNSFEAVDLLSAMKDIECWLGNVEGKTVLDIGSGSGLHSLAFLELNAKNVFSFDYDMNSVEATKLILQNHSKRGDWQVEQGSVLDHSYMLKHKSCYDIVYSWGVLHHTGNLWGAINNASTSVNNNGLLLISIYTYGPNYEKDLETKVKYNRGGKIMKKFMLYEWLLKTTIKSLLSFKSPKFLFERNARGMSFYYDVIDWLGGLPYEVATENQVLEYLNKRKFKLIKIGVAPEGSCTTYVFNKIG